MRFYSYCCSILLKSSLSTFNTVVRRPTLLSNQFSSGMDHGCCVLIVGLSLNIWLLLNLWYIFCFVGEIVCNFLAFSCLISWATWAFLCEFQGVATGGIYTPPGILTIDLADVISIIYANIQNLLCHLVAPSPSFMPSLFKIRLNVTI